MLTYPNRQISIYGSYYEKVLLNPPILFYLTVASARDNNKMHHAPLTTHRNPLNFS
jgi:hypothetical protein